LFVADAVGTLQKKEIDFFDREKCPAAALPPESIADDPTMRRCGR
jgi:hypothetical protein